MKKINSKKASLSIVIVNYNSGDYCIECINSINKSENVTFAQKPEEKYYETDSLRYSIDVIVVDNFSKDDSAKRIREHHPWVKLIALKKNVGFSKANNIGAAQNNNDYLLFLNPDTILESQTISGMLSYLESNERIGLTTCYLQMKITGDLDWACHRGLPTPWTSFCYYVGLSRIFPKVRLFAGYHLSWKNLKEEHEIFSPVGAFFLMPKKVYNLVGGFNNKYFLYGEDLDLAYMVNLKGYKVTFNPAYKAYHYKGMSSNIKKHSQEKISYSELDKAKAYHAFYDSMVIFYNRFLADRYPSYINRMVLCCIEIKRKLGKKKYTV
jgi:hypothetical protein